MLSSSRPAGALSVPGETKNSKGFERKLQWKLLEEWRGLPDSHPRPRPLPADLEDSSSRDSIRRTIAHMAFLCFKILAEGVLTRLRSWRMIGRGGVWRATTLKPARTKVDAYPVRDEL
jgi:hypothetical protein